MSVSKTDKSPYYYTRFTIKGIRIQESTGATSKSEALRYEEKRKKEVRDQVVYGVKPKRTWIEAATKWMLERKDKRSLKEDARKFKDLEQYFGHLYLDDINKSVIRELVQSLEVRTKQLGGGAWTAATINRYLALIKAVLNRAKNMWEWLDNVPYIEMKKENNQVIRWITKEEADRLMQHLPHHLKEMVEFTLATGLRLGNVTNLRWSEVDLNTKYITIPATKFKSGRVFSIPLNKGGEAVIKRQLRDINHDYVFHYKGQPILHLQRKAFARACAKAGIENFRWHDLRHTYVTWLAIAGVPAQVIMELVGHQDIKTTMRYLHVAKEHLREASEKVSEVI